MFDVGLWEMLLILVLALVIIGPERLPGAARKAGFYVGKARRFIEGVRTEVESELDVGEFKRMLHNQEVQINELQQQLKTGVDEVTADMPTASDVLQESARHSIEETSDDTAEDSPDQHPESGSEPAASTADSSVKSSVTDKEKS